MFTLSTVLWAAIKFKQYSGIIKESGKPVRSVKCHWIYLQCILLFIVSCIFTGPLYQIESPGLDFFLLFFFLIFFDREVEENDLLERIGLGFGICHIFPKSLQFPFHDFTWKISKMLRKVFWLIKRISFMIQVHEFFQSLTTTNIPFSVWKRGSQTSFDLCNFLNINLKIVMGLSW